MNAPALNIPDLRNVIDSDISQIMMQFNISKPSLLPRPLAWQAHFPNSEKSTGDYLARRFVSAEKVGVHAFALALQSVGFVMVDSCGRRFIPENPEARPRHRVRFIFARSKGLRILREQIDRVRTVGIPVFASLCNTAAWTVEAFRNDVEGGEGICINCSGRLPYKNSDGSANCMGWRDASGRLSEYAVPVAPARFLRIEQNEIIVS